LDRACIFFTTPDQQLSVSPAHSGLGVRSVCGSKDWLLPGYIMDKPGQDRLNYRGPIDTSLEPIRFDAVASQHRQSA
jgi:hypothetical protein